MFTLDGAQDGGPNLPPGSVNEGGQLFDLGVDVDGAERFVLAGGFGDAGGGARFARADNVAEALSGLAAQVAVLDGGAVLTAFARDADAKSGAVAIVAPQGGPVTAVGDAPPRAGARLVALEDGRALAIGGDPMVATYNPTGDRWDAALPAMTGEAPDVVAPTLVRLADGSVLVLAASGAWIYRPSLVGASSGTASVLPASAPDSGVLTAPDPSTVSRAAGWTVLAAGGRLAARARSSAGRGSRAARSRRPCTGSRRAPASR